MGHLYHGYVSHNHMVEQIKGLHPPFLSRPWKAFEAHPPSPTSGKRPVPLRFFVWDNWGRPKKNGQDF